MKKLLALFLSVMLILTLSACGADSNANNAGNSKNDNVIVLDENSVSDFMAELMEKSTEYENYLTRYHLAAIEYEYEEVEPDENGLHYVPVADESLNSIAKLKAATGQYFTDDYADKYLYPAFEGEYPMYKEFDGVLYVSVDGDGAGGFIYKTETCKIVSQTDTTCTISLDVQDTYETNYNGLISLKLEDGKWKIDSKSIE